MMGGGFSGLSCHRHDAGVTCAVGQMAFAQYVQSRV